MAVRGVRPTVDMAKQCVYASYTHSVLRLRGKGLPSFGGDYRGDLNLRIEVHIPEHLSAKERELYEQLRDMAKGDRKMWGRAVNPG